MNELADIKARAERDREARAFPSDYVAEMQADLDRAIAIAEDEKKGRHLAEGLATSWREKCLSVRATADTRAATILQLVEERNALQRLLDDARDVFDRFRVERDHAREDVKKARELMREIDIEQCGYNCPHLAEVYLQATDRPEYR